MAGPKALRGSNVEVQLLSQSGAGSAAQPVASIGVNNFTAEPMVTEDQHDYLGEQGSTPDIEVHGYSGTFDVEIRDKVILEMWDEIMRKQYANEPTDEIRIRAGLKMRGSVDSHTRIFKEVVLNVSENFGSRAGFGVHRVKWRSKGKPESMSI